MLRPPLDDEGFSPIATNARDTLESSQSQKGRLMFLSQYNLDSPPRPPRPPGSQANCDCGPRVQLPSTHAGGMYVCLKDRCQEVQETQSRKMLPRIRDIRHRKCQMNGYKCQMIYKMPDDRFKMPDNASGAYGILLLQAISCAIHSVPFPIDYRKNTTGRVSSA